MEASIKEPHIKNFIRLLQCASKFGDDLNIHARKDQWELAVTNSSKSAFCLFKLKRSFFCRFKAHGTTSAQRKGIKCQLLVKSVLAVLGKASSIANVDRVDLTIIDSEHALTSKKAATENGSTDITGGDEEEYEDGYAAEAELRGIEAKLIMKLVCKYGVTKKHSLHLGTSDFPRAEVDPDSTPSSFKVSAKSLRDMLDHFALVSAPGLGPTGMSSLKGESQLGWMFSRKEVRIKSWEGASQALMTEIRVDSREFEDFWVEAERVDLTLPMKEFRAALLLAEQIGISFAIAYSEATQPLTLTSISESPDSVNSTDDFEIFCAIATTTCEAFASVPTLTASGSDRKPTRTPSESRAGPSRSDDTDLTRDDDQPGPNRVNGTTPSRESPMMGDTDPSRARSMSVNPKGKRARLDMTTQEGSSRRVTVIMGSSQAVKEDGDEPPSQSSQRVQMTQKELLEFSGLGDMEGLEEMMDEDDDEFAVNEEHDGQGGEGNDNTRSAADGEVDKENVRGMRKRGDTEVDFEEFEETQENPRGEDGFSALFDD